MSTSAIVVLFLATLVLFGGLATSIAIAIRATRRDRRGSP
ncbi:MetS family NSS transporter small subunit [Nitriliruptor alkaliphilus]|nr:MetS family NSS transporter small subunit [Nitriliruptor alkaliphilus]